MGQHHLYVQAQDADGKGINDIPVEIRWETLRDGMEDYEYLWLLAGGDPEIGVSNAADDFVAQLVDSRTLFSRNPLELAETRAAIAAKLGGPAGQKSADPPAIAPGQSLTYTIAYAHSGDPTTLLVSDAVPTKTRVITALASTGVVTVSGQSVVWRAPVSGTQRLTLTIRASATRDNGSAVLPGVVVNTASFSAGVVFTASTGVLIYSAQVYLPLVLK